MSQPIARRYSLHHIATPTLASPVIDAAWLRQLEAAEQMILNAHAQSDAIINKAQEQAQLIAFDASRAAQQQVWDSAMDEWSSFCESRQHWLNAAQTMLEEVLKLALNRLKLEVSDTEIIRSNVALLLNEWSGSHDAVLKVHPMDLTISQTLLGNRANCIVMAVDTMPPGVSELHCGETLLRANFVANVDALVSLAEFSTSQKESI